MYPASRTAASVPSKSCAICCRTLYNWMPGLSPNGIPNVNFVDEIAATAAAPPIKFLRVTGRIFPPTESTILLSVRDLAKPRSTRSHAENRYSTE
jgi:hypothetical protein